MKHRKKKKGASLIIVLMVLAVAMIFSSVTLTTISKTTKANAQEKKSEDVLFSAESGLEYGIAWFNKNKTTGVISVPPTNGCTYDVKVEPDGSNYKIISKATINGKSKTVSVRVNRKETPGTGGETITLDNPLALIVPNNNSIFYSGINPVNKMGVNPTYHINNVLNYRDNSKMYNIIKDNWGTDVNPKISQYAIEKPFNVEYKVNTLTPFQYNSDNINIPPYNVSGDITIGTNYEQYRNPVSGKIEIISRGKVTIFSGSYIELKNAIIYADTIEVYGTSSNVTIKDSTMIAKKIKTTGSQKRTFNNTRISADEVTIEGSNEREFINGTQINTKTFILNATNNSIIDFVKINAEVISITGSETRNITNSEIKANTINMNVSNGSLLENTNIICGRFYVSGSCNKIYKNGLIVANEVYIESSNDVEFNNFPIYTNTLSLTGSTFKRFNNSIVVSKNINITSGNNIEFYNTLTVSDRISYIANDLIINPITDKNIFNSKFIEAQKYLTITGQSTPPTITYEIDNSSIKYE